GSTRCCPGGACRSSPWPPRTATDRRPPSTCRPTGTRRCMSSDSASPRLSAVLAGFCEKRILVVGDLMLDEFLWGKVSRISPEAPVPVVEVIREEWFPGGAANVARNLAEFTKHASVLGVTGDCPQAARLRELLVSEGV